MRLAAVFLYELRLQARRPTVWLYAAAVLGVGALMTYEELQAAGGGSTLFDAPVEVASPMLLVSLFGLLTAAALAADTATRDASTRIEPLLFTTPLRRLDYLGGRFLAAFALYAFVLFLFPLGHMIAARFLVSPELVGPFRPLTWVQVYLFIGLPNAFVSTALLFAVAALSRRAVASYVAAAVIVVGTLFSFQASVSLFAAWKFAGLVDPLGFAALMRTAQTWTPAQRNVLPLPLEGELLWNRAAWGALALLVLALTAWRWGVRVVPGAARRRRARGEPDRASLGRAAPSPAAAEVVIPSVRRRFGAGAAVRQTLTIARRAFLDVATSWGALVIGGIAILHVVMGPELMEHLGVPLYPTTPAVVRVLTEPGTGVIVLASLLAIFYAGELVWKERDLRLAPLTGTSPVGDWPIVLGKFLGLVLVLAALQTLLMGAGMITQLILGYREVEPLVYLQTLLGLRLAELALLAMLAIAVQVIAGGKYVGWLATALAYAAITMPQLGIEHHLLLYTSTPGWTYTGMRGFGGTLAPALWFTAWWAAWAALLALAARLLLLRGIDLPLRERLSRARQRSGQRTVFAALGATGAAAGVGGFVFWNTNVLHDYRPEEEQVAESADYERRYGAFDAAPRPTLAATSLRIELYPSERRASVHGTYVLRNDTGAPIDTVHLATIPGVETGEIAFARPARAALVDDALGHRIYVLGAPLLPGDSVALEFAVRYASRGFTNDGAPDAVLENGTYLELDEWLPGIGYQPQRELTDDDQRDVYGLPPRPVPGPADAAAAALRAGRERGRFDAVIGTEAGEIAAVPGVLRRSWTGNGRAYFDYAAPVPITRRRGLFSARYGVHRSEWRGIPIEVLYHPEHPWNAKRLAEAAAVSLEHFTRTIGPYPFGVVRLIERPSAASGATAFAGMVAYSEPLALMRPDADEREIDFLFGVIAHEMAHQWFGNQLVPAPVAGGALLSESLAWYGAFGVVEETYGRKHLLGLLDLMHEAYLAPMPRAHPPLLEAVDWFLAYRKGAFAMFAAREYLGKERMNGALRRLLDAQAEGRIPHPSSVDLYAELKAAAPDSLKPLLHDLFAANVWWSFYLRWANAERLPSGEWTVTLAVRSFKAEVDTLGTETLLPLDELVEIGLYAEDPDAEPVYLGMHRIHERDQIITITVPELPAEAVVNPRHLLMDDVADGDSRPVVVTAASAQPSSASNGSSP